MKWDGRKVYDSETKEYLGRAVGEPFDDGVEGMIHLRQDQEGQTIRRTALCGYSLVSAGPDDWEVCPRCYNMDGGCPFCGHGFIPKTGYIWP